MNKKALSIMIMLLASTLIIGIQPMSTKAAGSPTIAILPSSQTFNNPAINTQFTVNCTLSNMVNLYGVDIQVGWNTSVIQYVSHTKTIPKTATNHGILNSPTVPVHDDENDTAAPGGSNIASAAPGTNYWVAEAAMSPAAPFNGVGNAFLMTFQIIYVPPVGGATIHTKIHFYSVTLANSSGVSIPNVVQIDGNITIIPAAFAYPPYPLLKVSSGTSASAPADIYGVYNQRFDVNILLMGVGHVDLDPLWDVAGFDFMVTYNSTLIKGMNATCDPDGWFASFWPGGIFTVQNGTDDVTGLAWIVFLGIPNTSGAHYTVHGQGRIAAVHFNATYEYTPPPPDVTCPLNIINVTIAGYAHPERAYPPWNGSLTAVPLPYQVENGMYHAPIKMISGIDIYTDYPPHYNGTGPNMPSDMLWPQKGFHVYAYVQYNRWPEQMKDVAFQLIDPYGTVRAVYYNTTDSSGLCWVFVRFPWPCIDPEHEFGYVNGVPTPWKIVATVDIACVVYNDTMPFKYDYRVRIFKTTLDKTAYDHGEYITVTIYYGTVSMQTFNVTFSVTATDCTGVPFGFAQITQTVGGAAWCTMKNDTISLKFQIPKYARASPGPPTYPATVYVGVVSQRLDAYYPTRLPETIVQFAINAS
jgi:hypothetical protein